MKTRNKIIGITKISLPPTRFDRGTGFVGGRATAVPRRLTVKLIQIAV